MKTIAVFQSEEFELPWAKGDPESKPSPFGEDLANHLRQRLEANGYHVSEPAEDEDCWCLRVKVDNIDFDFIVRWAPLGEPPQDWWVVQTGLPVGLFRSIFGGKPESSRLQPICRLLQAVLDKDTHIHGVKWLDDEVFGKFYAGRL